MARLNQRYAKYISADKIEYAPVAFKENNAIIVPIQTDDNFFNSRGYYNVINVVPESNDPTKHYEFSRYEKDDEKKEINLVYSLENNQETITIHKYSKLKLTMFMMNLGIWESVKEWLIEIGYYDLYLIAQVLADDNDNFNNAKGMFKDRFQTEIENIDTVIAQALAYSLVESEDKVVE